MNGISNNLILGNLCLEVGKKYYFKLRDGYIAGKVEWYRGLDISYPWMTCFVPVIQLANGNRIAFHEDAKYTVRNNEDKVLFTSDYNDILIYFKEKENIGLTEAECSYHLPFYRKEYCSYESKPCYNTMGSTPRKFIEVLEKKCTIKFEENRVHGSYSTYMYYIDYDKGKVCGERVFFRMYIDDNEKIMKTCIYGFNNNEHFKTQKEAEANYNKFLSLTIVDFEPTEEERIAEENKAKKEAILKKIEELKEEANKL